MSQVKITSPCLFGKLSISQESIHNMTKAEDFQTIFLFYPEENATAPEAIKESN